MTIRGGKQLLASLSGVSNGFFRVQGLNFIAGNRFTSRDLDEREPVVIIDPNVQNSLFPGGQDPLGEIVQLSGVPYRVIGVAAKKDQSQSASSPARGSPTPRCGSVCQVIRRYSPSPCASSTAIR